MELEALAAEVARYAPAMRELGIRPPDTGDLWDVRRALEQLRQRLVLDLEETEYGLEPAYKHETNLGRIPDYTDELGRLYEVAVAATPSDWEVIKLWPQIDRKLAWLAVELKGALPEEAKQIKAEMAKYKAAIRFSLGFKEQLAAFDASLADQPWRQELWRKPENLVRGLATIKTSKRFTPEHVDSVHARLAQLNPRRRGRRNPLPEKDLPLLSDYLKGHVGVDPKELMAVFSKREEEARALGLTPERVGAIFPHEGSLQRPDSWDASERIPAALSQYDLVSRMGEPEPPSADLIEALQEGKDPISDQAALDYIRAAAGLSLNEAQRVLGEMKRSAEGRRSPNGQRVAMQPSSAMCKLYRSRKLSAFKPPRTMFEKVGTHAVVILMSPPSETPRVMTWRRGAHIDCDMALQHPKDLLQALSRALQSALFWVAEKPGRQADTRIYVGTVGAKGLYLVWQPGEVVSIDVASANLARQKGEPALPGVPTGTLEDYNQALMATFGTTVVRPKRQRRDAKRRDRAPRKERAVRAAAPKPQAPVEKSYEGMTLAELKEVAKAVGLPGRSKLRNKDALIAALRRGSPAPAPAPAPSPSVRAPVAREEGLEFGEEDFDDEDLDFGEEEVVAYREAPQASSSPELDLMAAATGTAPSTPRQGSFFNKVFSTFAPTRRDED